MHAILSHECTGCGLCVAPCPVDCIEMVNLPEATYDKDLARKRFHGKQRRILREEHGKQQLYREKKQLAIKSNDYLQDIKAKQDYIQQALLRVKAKKSDE